MKKIKQANCQVMKLFVTAEDKEQENEKSGIIQRISVIGW